MNEPFNLDELPKVKASASFEDRLFADAMSMMPRDDLESEVHTETRFLNSKSVPIWMSFAMAASLAVGLWLGFGQTGVMQESLTGLGLTQETAAAELGIDAYNDTLFALN